MTTLLLVEPDDAVRGELLQRLAFQGFDTLWAADGAAGLAQCRAFLPHLVICGSGLPGPGAHGLLSAIRADAQLPFTPVILLLPQDEPAAVAAALAAGASDCVAAPYAARLLDSIDAQLRQRGASTGQPSPEATAGTAGIARNTSAPAEPLPDSTLLFSRIRNLATLSEKLRPDELAALLDSYFAKARQRLQDNGALSIYRAGAGLLAVFRAQDGQPAPASRRAVASALSMALDAHEFRHWLHAHHPGLGLPPLAIATGIDTGDALRCQVGAAHDSESVVIGEAVNKAVRLESAGHDMGWTVVVSEAVLAACGDGVQTGVRSRLLLPAVDGQPPAEAIEITGIGTAQDGTGGQALADALRFNAELTARATQGALDATLAVLADPAFDAGGAPVNLKGYRVIRKLASGGMSEVYLAERASDGTAIVLKVLDLQVRRQADHLSRFIQEYALLSAIAHPHVIRIHDQGVTDAHAYIAMEYFSGGSLRSLIGTPALTQARSLQLIREIASALAALHAAGIVHCDIKPENILLRADGSAALADFGIARKLRSPTGEGGTQTDAQDHDLIGTPYYLSPEQAAGQPPGSCSDLYSLGVMLFEMLTGRRPFAAESLASLRAQHREAATPALPAAHRRLQPIVDRLMQKKPADRYDSAADLLRDLAALQN